MLGLETDPNSDELEQILPVQHLQQRHRSLKIVTRTIEHRDGTFGQCPRKRRLFEIAPDGFRPNPLLLANPDHGSNLLNSI
jgi:hypothetical protein